MEVLFLDITKVKIIIGQCGQSGCMHALYVLNNCGSGWDINNLNHNQWLLGYYIQEGAFARASYRVEKLSIREVLRRQLGKHTFPVDPQQRPSRFPYF